MLNSLKLRNFKCFNDMTIDFNKLTILAGGNAAGKSSVIQAILFYFCMLDKNSRQIDINNVYDLRLGVAKSLVSHNPKGHDNFIEIGAEMGNCSGQVILKPRDDAPTILEYVDFANLNGDVYIKYLKAERAGSRTTTQTSGNYDDLGYSGEFSPYVIEAAEKKDIKIHSKVITGENGKFSAQVENWMSEIMGSKMDIDISTDYSRGFTDTKIKNPATEFGVVPTLTGFGISYVMPIVVAGLLCSAHPDSVLIVENPEAHLHPMAQSNIGKFLALLAQCGVQVIVETHSEHIVDGARVQLKKDKGTERMLIDFFEIKDRQITMVPITLKNNGELTYWPKGFFDQKQSDIRELLGR